MQWTVWSSTSRAGCILFLVSKESNRFSYAVFTRDTCWPTASLPYLPVPPLVWRLPPPAFPLRFCVTCGLLWSCLYLNATFWNPRSGRSKMSRPSRIPASVVETSPPQVIRDWLINISSLGWADEGVEQRFLGLEAGPGGGRREETKGGRGWGERRWTESPWPEETVNTGDTSLGYKLKWLRPNPVPHSSPSLS